MPKPANLPIANVPGYNANGNAIISEDNVEGSTASFVGISGRRETMSLYRFLRSVGFEHEDIAGGLLAEPPATRLNERQEKLTNRIRKVYARLVRHRRALEDFKERARQNQHVSRRITARLQRHERAYDHHFQLLTRLKQKLQHLRGQLAM
jgi:hypothetical protein